MTGETPDWTLLYKHRNGRPHEFCEIRRIESAVWVRSGAVNTWGSCTITEYRSTEEADARFQTARQEKTSEGFALTREGTYDPSRFDFDRLREEIRDGARQAFTVLRAAHPGENINAFALISDESAMTLGPAAGSEESLPDNEGDEGGRFNPDEWPYYEGAEFLDIAYRLILTQHQDLPSTVPFEEFQPGVFEAAIRALEELDQENFFGAGPARENVVLLFHVTDGDAPEDTARRLNPPGVYARYQAWRQSWS